MAGGSEAEVIHAGSFWVLVFLVPKDAGWKKRGKDGKKDKDRRNDLPPSGNGPGSMKASRKDCPRKKEAIKPRRKTGTWRKGKGTHRPKTFADRRGSGT